MYKHADLIASIIVNHTLKSCHKTKTCTQWAFCHNDLQKFKLSIGMGKKGDLSNSERGTVVGARWDSLFQKLLICWEFPTQLSLGFTENGGNKGKYPVNSSPLGENALLISEVREE